MWERKERYAMFDFSDFCYIIIEKSLHEFINKEESL